ncbi:MAG: hypothetical protein FJ304_15625 [Planctomycetes bacterium]|nr:hypothetical protein [Planctomycetota bacterium]
MRRLAFLVLLLCGCGRAPAPPAPEPARTEFRFPNCNVVFVSFDALQAAHVGHLGNPRPVTPTIDSLARTGFTFTSARSVAPWTVPASMTWFTGVYPSEHRMVNKFAVFNARERKPADLRDRAPNLATLAQLMRLNGYATGGFTGNAGVSAGFGFELGFDTYYQERDTFGGFDRSVPKALEWVRANRDRKFFLFLHGYDCHGQRLPPGGLDYRFVAADYDKRFTGAPREQELLREEGLDRGRAAVRPADVDFWRAVYDEKIARADAQFRRFLDEFDALGLTANTVFVLTSDHGTEFHEHGRFDHGFALYDEHVRVPLVINLPGAGGGKQIAHRVSGIDVMPTVLDLAGATVPEAARKQLRGTSLVPALKGEAVARDVYSETDYREYTYKRSVVTPDGWKLIYTLETRTRELYDLTADPGETRDISKTDPRRADELQKKVFDHFARIGHDLTARPWERGLNPVYPSQGK